VDRVNEQTDAQALADLAAGFPGWHIWRGRGSRGADTDWHATRRRKLTRAQASAGMMPALAAGSAPSLRALLGQQQAITTIPGHAT
jgi:hypothetical protein